MHISPQSHALLECQLDNDKYKKCTGLVIPNPQLEDKSSVVLTSSLNTIDDSGKVFISAINFSETQVTFNKSHKKVAKTKLFFLKRGRKVHSPVPLKMEQ